MPKTALIVDDSKTARIVLKRMLETHALKVDTAESAEDALEYLNDHRPDVVFMDHLMPGMDGFEAVTAIKNNPETATIPIMMYTSQKGELYVGQARALGAIGVLPKEVEPVEVSKVLQSLRVIGGDAAGRRDDTGEAPSSDAPDLRNLDQNLRELIQDLFDQQRAVLRRDLLASYDAIATKVANEIRPPQTEADPADVQEPFVQRLQKPQVAIAALLVALLVVGWSFWQRGQQLDQVLARNSELLQELEQQRSLESQGAARVQRQIDEYQRTLGSAFVAAVDALEWGVNQTARYDFGEPPLGDARLAIFQDMSARLLAMGFSGQVRVESHVGDFCMVAVGGDQFEKALTDMAASQCDAIGYGATSAYEIGLAQSVAFANFVNRSREQTDGRIRYEVVSMGNTQPLLPYPDSPGGVTASDWNEIAAVNNRVIVSLFPD